MQNMSDCWDRETHQKVIENTSHLLWRFIQSNAKESTAESVMLQLTNLSANDLATLVNIRLILSPCVSEFVLTIVPKIINRLSKESLNEVVIDRNKVQGQVNWPKTINTRIANGNDKTLFAYNKRKQQFDLIENRVFVFLLRKLDKIIRNFSKNDYSRLTWYAENESQSKWTDKIAVIGNKVSRILRNPYICNIEIINKIDEVSINKIANSRLGIYKEMLPMIEKYNEAQNKPVKFLGNELNRNILEPLNKDTLFEIAVLFNTITTLSTNGWTETKVGLIGSNNKIISTMVKGTTKINIYTQTLPQEFKENTVYGRIMAKHGLSEKLRRPDIILEIVSENKKEFLIVEVKRSKRRSYLVDGAYKVLGYLKDFESISVQNAYLSGFLVGWSGINQCDFDENEIIHLFNWEEYGEGLISFLNSK